MSSSSPKSSHDEPRSPRPGPVPVSIGARTRQLLPRDPQAIFNPSQTNHLALADSQIIHPLIEIVNPPPLSSRKRLENGLGYDREKEGLKKRRTTTREERLEALTFLENGREWYEDTNGIAGYQNLIVVAFSSRVTKAILGDMILEPLSLRRAATILGYNESQLRKWKGKENEILNAKENTRSIGMLICI